MMNFLKKSFIIFDLSSCQCQKQRQISFYTMSHMKENMIQNVFVMTSKIETRKQYCEYITFIQASIQRSSILNDSIPLTSFSLSLFDVLLCQKKAY